MRVKICGVRSEADVAAVVAADADAAGFLVGQIHPSPDFILASTAGRLAGELPPFITPVLVTHLSEAESIGEIILKSGINTVQLHGGCDVGQLAKLRHLFPHAKLVLAAHVLGDRVIPELEDSLPLVDAVLLDSLDQEKGLVGGTGAAHNWLTSAEFVKKCHLPVILAGGLKPENVAEAIKLVKPYGVDANSGLRGGDGFRDPEKCAAFVARAKGWRREQAP